MYLWIQDDTLILWPEEWHYSEKNDEDNVCNMVKLKRIKVDIDVMRKTIFIHMPKELLKKKEQKKHGTIIEDIKKDIILNNIKLCTRAKICYWSKISEKYSKICYWLCTQCSRKLTNENVGFENFDNIRKRTYWILRSHLRNKNWICLSVCFF